MEKDAKPRREWKWKLQNSAQSRKQKMINQKTPQTTHGAGTYPVYVSDAAKAERMKMENTELNSEILK